MFYDLAHNTWGEEEINAVTKVLKSGMFTMGENVQRFEQEFAKKFGKRHAIMVGSGSAANLVALAALFYRKENPLKAGDEVIVPAISWATTYYPLQQYGLKLRFVDVDLETLNLDVKQLETALTPKTRMVLGVSILGNPCALPEMRAFCDRHNLILFEDNCESMGAEVGGRACGTWGDVGTFSTFFSHHISTIEGGVIVTDDEEIHHLCLAIRAHGWTRNLPPDSPIYDRKEDDFYEAYRFIVPGYNARPMEISAAAGIEQLKKLDAMIEIRRKNATLFQDLFRNDPRLIIQKENGKSSWFSFTLILNPNENIDRTRVMQALKRADIGYRIITGGNFLRHDVIKYFDYSCVGEMTNADLAHYRGFFVGNHPTDLSLQLVQLREVLSEALSPRSTRKPARSEATA
jgi:CDP-6-deoxy-D-xylo-4-hexulose-3-dehydrase